MMNNQYSTSSQRITPGIPNNDDSNIVSSSNNDIHAPHYRRGSSPYEQRYNNNHERDITEENESIPTPPWENTIDRETYLHRCAERAWRRRRDNENYNDTSDEMGYNHEIQTMPNNHSREEEMAECNDYEVSESVIQQQQHHDPREEQSSPPRSTKSVSFNTRDKIHQWDDQLELLKHVDEAFFGAAQYLLEDVHDVTSSTARREYDSDDFEVLYQGYDTGIEREDGGILSKLFHCGDALTTATDTTSYVSDGYNNCIPYLGIDGKIIDDGTCKGMTSQSIKKKRFKLTEKLLEDLKAAVEYRMQKLDNYDSLEHVEQEEVVKTREIAWKVEAYGLPKVWKNECQVSLQQNPNVDGNFRSPSAHESFAVSSESCHIFPCI